MSLTSLSDIRTGEWSREIAKKAEIPFSLLPTPYDPCDIVGGVTEEAARITGLKAGTPVSAGCLDSVVATLGAGAVQEGDVALTIGSSGRTNSSLIKFILIMARWIVNRSEPFLTL